MAARRYWLLKSEPNVFSIDDLCAEPGKETYWEGVRNYQARNYMRDEMKVGDGVLFYHSRQAPIGVAGTAVVVRAAYPDDTAFDPNSPYFDPKSDPEHPRWVRIDVRHTQTFDKVVTLAELKANPKLDGMVVIKRGSRLSVQPVTEAQWIEVHRMAGTLPRWD